MDQPDVPAITRAHLAADMQRLGIAAGDTVMLHASVKAIGWIVGGPRVVLDTLLERLTPAGTLMMLASWEGNPYGMDDWPDAQRDAWLAECPAFDPRTSPADHRELSILAEYLRTCPGAWRSQHPLASMVALGARAQLLTADHPLQYGHGSDGPLARLCAAGGKVLLLGAAFSNITLLHHAEHVAAVPTKRVDRYGMPVLRDGQRVWIDIEEYDTTNGIADFGVDDYFAAIGQAFVDAGNGRAGRVGNAASFLFEADELKQFGIQWLEAQYQGP